jgi:electron transport complex protein RnfE
MDKRTLREIFADGIFTDNTVFKLAISLCPTIAVTNSLKNGFFLGMAVLAVQTLVNATVSLLRNFIHPRIRIPIFMLVISGWVSVVDMIMAAYVRDVYREIGLFIQIIVAYASILAHAETFASKNKLTPSVVDGIGMGVGYLIALIIISFVRELLGKGTLWGYEILSFKPMLIMILPTGGFLVVGLLMGFFNWMGYWQKSRAAKAERLETLAVHAAEEA